MQITIEVPDSLAAVAAGHGLTPEMYAARLVTEFVPEPSRTPSTQQSITSTSDVYETQPDDAQSVEERVLQAEIFIRELAKFSSEIKTLPEEAFTRESIYADHD